MLFSERRFKRKVRKRQELLRLMENRAETMTIPEDTVIVLTEHQERLLHLHEPWKCPFCDRDFLSYPALLNHKCDDG